MSLERDIPDWFRFTAYFEGQGTAEERAEIERWMRAHQTHDAMARAMQGIWHTHRQQRAIATDAGEAFARANTAAGIERVMRSLASAERQATPRREAAGMAGGGGVTPLFRPWRQTRVRYALLRGAGLGVAVGAAILAFGVTLATSSHQPWQRGSTPHLRTEGKQYIAPAGRLMTVRLGDGSTIILAPGTTLRTKPGFGTDVRDVSLDGEAYFSVTHDIHMPFRVQTAQGFVEDIGTKFAVRIYAGDTARVVVSEGKVAIGTGVVLGAGDVARITAGVPSHIQRGIPVEHLLAWTTGVLEFQLVPLRDVVADLSRWYGVEIRVDDDALASHPVTATFRAMSVAATLEHLARVTGARIDIKGTARILTPGSSVTPAL